MPDPEALDIIFRFFNEWLETSGPRGSGPASVRGTRSDEEIKILITANIIEGHGGFECEVRSDTFPTAVHWQHDYFEWVSARRVGGKPKWEAEGQTSWEDVDDVAPDKLAGAAAAFICLPIQDVDELLANGWKARIIPQTRGGDVRTLEVKKIARPLKKESHVRARHHNSDINAAGGPAQRT